MENRTIENLTKITPRKRRFSPDRSLMSSLNLSAKKVQLQKNAKRLLEEYNKNLQAVYARERAKAWRHHEVIEAAVNESIAEEKVALEKLEEASKAWDDAFLNYMNAYTRVREINHKNVRRFEKLIKTIYSEDENATSRKEE